MYQSISTPIPPGKVLQVAGKGMVVLQALATAETPVVKAQPAAAVPSIPPAPAPTAGAREYREEPETTPHQDAGSGPLPESGIPGSTPEQPATATPNRAPTPRQRRNPATTAQDHRNQVAKVLENKHRGMKSPRSTYRLQVTADWTLDDARDLVPYLTRLGGRLGVSVPGLLAAEPGSTHGYDVVDHKPRPMPTGAARRAFGSFVTRHTRPATGCWWTSCPTMSGWRPHPCRSGGGDVLMHGPESRHAKAFDIDWAGREGSTDTSGAGFGRPRGIGRVGTRRR